MDRQYKPFEATPFENTIKFPWQYLEANRFYEIHEEKGVGCFPAFHTLKYPINQKHASLLKLLVPTLTLREKYFKIIVFYSWSTKIVHQI